MPLQKVAIGLSSRPGRFGPDGGARLINAYAEQTAGDARSPWTYYCRPGLSDFATLAGGGTFRGGIDFGANAYVVSGPKVFKVDASGTATEIGSFGGSLPVSMARNRKAPDAQIVMVSDGLRAIISADVVSLITDTDLPAPIDVDSIGGYFVFAIEDGQYFWSSIDEGTAYDGADFASAEANPDGLVAIKARGQEIVLFGTKSIEFHALTGSEAVFERVQQTTLPLGCLSRAAVKLLNGIPIFPASDGTIRQLSSYQPVRISNHDVERDIDELSDKTTMTAFSFTLEGHHYYVLNSADWTWVCDLLTNNWYQWSSYGSSRWDVEGFVDVEGRRIVGHKEDAVLYELDPDVNDDNGEHLVWRIVTGAQPFPQREIVDELYCNLLSGVGLNSTTTSESDPQVILRVSDDDGKTWSSEMTQPVGAIGEFDQEVSFRQLGSSGRNGFRYELTMSAPVSRALTNVAKRFTPLAP